MTDEGDFCFYACRHPRVVRSVVEAVDRLAVSVLLRLVGLEAVEDVTACEEEFGSVSPEVSIEVKEKCRNI